MATDSQARLRDVLAMVAPGTPLRDGLERILRGRTGALVVLGLDRSVESLTRSGFPLDIDFTATRLRELAKKDAILGGISTGANVKAALEVASRPENAGKTIATVICDFGERYVSTILYEDIRD